MRLDLLIKRENFSEVFNKTLSKYMLEKYNWTGEIVWTKMKYKRTSKVFLANHKLNIIYPSNLNRDYLREIVKEYSYNSNFLRRFIQKLYIHFSFSFELLTTNSMINIKPWSSVFNDICIIPGNHSIRLIDFKQNLCIVILKEGFNKDFINQELKLRKKHPYLPIPKLLNADNNFYVEEQISVLPINRIENQLIKDKAIKDAQLAMVSLYNINSKSFKVNSILDNILGAIAIALKKLPSVYSDNEKAHINKIANWLQDIVLPFSNENIDIVQSHGDFQPANIVIDSYNESKLYLIDWEYTNKRSFFYDALVFASMSRSPSGLSKRMHNIFIAENQKSWQWCFGTKNNRYKLLNWMVAIFLLEDLLVRLQELMIPTLKKSDNGLNIWLIEVEMMGWLNND